MLVQLCQSSLVVSQLTQTGTIIEECKKEDCFNKVKEFIVEKTKKRDEELNTIKAEL